MDGKNGFHLITPLVRTDGSTVLVDRGFISEPISAKKKFSTPEGEVEIHGMLRESQARNSFTPDNNLCQVRDRRKQCSATVGASQTSAVA